MGEGRGNLLTKSTLEINIHELWTDVNKLKQRECTIMDLKNFMKSTGAYPQQTTRPKMFEEFEATELYCPQCKRAVPVRKRLLLVIPEGDKYEYLCSLCSSSVGTKIDRQNKPMTLVV